MDRIFFGDNQFFGINHMSEEKARAQSIQFQNISAIIRVLEIAPPWVRTDLMNSREAEEAMPLDQFIEETMAVLESDANEILVDGARAFSSNPGPNEHARRMPARGR